MARTPREKILLIGVGAMVGVFVLNRYVYEPFRDARVAYDTDTQLAREQLIEADKLMNKERRMRRDWSAMQSAGIESGTWDAERDMLRAMQTWVQQAGITNASLRPDRQATEHGFVKVTIHVTGTGPSAAMAKLLWSIESASVPVRVDTLQLIPSAQKEGTDELRLTLAASRLCAVPDSEAKPNAGRQQIATGEVRP